MNYTFVFLGRRFYSDEQKKAMYETYLEKGLQETAKQFGVNVPTVYAQVHRYRSRKVGEDFKYANRLRHPGVIPARDRKPKVQQLETKQDGGGVVDGDDDGGEEEYDEEVVMILNFCFF